MCVMAFPMVTGGDTGSGTMCPSLGIQHAYGLSGHQQGKKNGEWFTWAHATNGDRNGLIRASRKGGMARWAHAHRGKGSWAHLATLLQICHRSYG